MTFTVQDTGLGIPVDAQARIFLEFEQVDGGLTRRFGGTGLGLAITKRIVERMGGEIGVDSTPGAGSSFHFTVVLPPVGDPEPRRSGPDLRGADVLVVAPPCFEGPLAARHLEGWGAHTRMIADATAARALARERHWDAVLVDHSLGLAAVRTLAGELGTKAARRIVLIAPGDRGDLPALKQAGFTGYLVKPVRKGSLAARFAVDTDRFEAEPAGGIPEVGTSPTLEHPAAWRALSILVAEDNEVNALLARSLLQRLGHVPAVVTNGAVAVQSWLAARTAGTPYDLVLMDVNMPDLDGLEACRRIRAVEAESGSGRTPIIALTANGLSEDRDACAAAGMDGFVVKPLDREELAAALAAVSRSVSAPLAA